MRSIAVAIRERSRRWNTVVVVALALLLTACSTRLVYNYLDWIIPWYAEDYVDLTPAQEAYFEQKVDELLAWHRQVELPKYVRLLESLQQTLGQDTITADELDYYVVQVQEAWTRIVVKSTPALVAVVQTLSDEQVQLLMTKLRQSEQKQVARYSKMNEMKQRVRSYDRMGETLEKWIGPLTPEQSRLVGLWSQRRPLTTEDWLDYRIVWNNGLDETLQRRNEAIFTAMFKPLLLEEGEYASHPYKLSVPESIHYTTQFLATLHGTLTNSQRNRLDGKSEQYIRDFRYLSRSG